MSIEEVMAVRVANVTITQTINLNPKDINTTVTTTLTRYSGLLKVSHSIREVQVIQMKSRGEAVNKLVSITTEAVVSIRGSQDMVIEMRIKIILSSSCMGSNVVSDQRANLVQGTIRQKKLIAMVTSLVTQRVSPWSLGTIGLPSTVHMTLVTRKGNSRDTLQRFIINLLMETMIKRIHRHCLKAHLISTRRVKGMTFTRSNKPMNEAAP